MKRAILFVSIFTVFFASAVGQTSGQWLVQCSDSLVKKNYQDAVAKCTKAIEAQPDSIEALQLRASAYEKIAYYVRAIGDYTSLIRLTKGDTKYYFYRAELYRMSFNARQAIEDYTTVITKEPTGQFTAKSHLGRGLVFEKGGDKVRSEADFRKAVQLDPWLSDASKKLDHPVGDVTVNKAADGKVSGINTSAKPSSKPEAAPVISPPDWKRTVLTGTGLSVASPIPFKLERSEPLASLDGNVEAEVSWKFEQGGLRAYVVYTKEDKGYKAVRQHLEDGIQYLLNNAKAVESLIHDTKFLGETGAFYDEVEFEQSSNRSMRRKVLVFGGPIAYRRILHIFPADDTAAALLSSQIIASFKNEGSLAVGKPRFPPLEWKLYNFGGVLFEFPAKPSEDCKGDLPERVSETCAVWGNSVSVRVLYSTYRPGVRQLTAMQEAEEHVKFSKELENSSRSTSRSDYRIAAFPINIGEAALVVKNTGLSKTQTIFIRRDNALWQVIILYSTVFDKAGLAGERAVKSIRFKN